jgi:hypothetical protein
MAFCNPQLTVNATPCLWRNAILPALRLKTSHPLKFSQGKRKQKHEILMPKVEHFMKLDYFRFPAAPEKNKATSK